ncbi:hypothetical protein SprV_0100265700 [Sparganum proliferum]
MLMDAYRDERPGFRVAYRTDGQLLNHLWKHFQSYVSTTVSHELLFANDCTLNASSEGDLQRSMHLFVAACDNFGPVINTEKTVVMYQLPPDAAYTAHHINVNGAQLQVVGKFTYLGLYIGLIEHMLAWPVKN